jgi:hypothetical protein
MMHCVLLSFAGVVAVAVAVAVSTARAASDAAHDALVFDPLRVITSRRPLPLASTRVAAPAARAHQSPGPSPDAGFRFPFAFASGCAIATAAAIVDATPTPECRTLNEGAGGDGVDGSGPPMRPTVFESYTRPVEKSVSIL